ncbi:MAG: cytochrome C peroxidase [Gemmataceae bacterium]|nr:cytochrome C peroxidase [Gemmataceae bacterium]
MPRLRCAVALAALAAGPAAANPPTKPTLAGLTEPADYLLPNDGLMIPFRDQVPLVFVTKNSPEWAGLKTYFTEGTEQAVDPATGESVTRRVIKVKVPAGLTTAPPVPAENPLTLAKWNLGKKLYFDPLLSTSGQVACASCHSPDKGYTDQRKASTGIGGAVGGINSPTVINSAYNPLQFWDGRALTLEDQSQGPVGNNKEMFGGKHDPWEEAVLRLRNSPEYVKAFARVFGHAPTRDAAAKAIAAYERTVLVGNGLHDRAEAAMRARVTEEESGKFETKAEDYAAAVKGAFAAKDARALAALGLDAEKDAGKADEVGKRLFTGRTLFFGKARCSNCHAGDTLSDGMFHNLGVGVTKDGEVPYGEFGRFAVLRTGHKDTALVGAFKTPGLRGLSGTAPYMHSGDEKTLEDVVEFYDRGGNANPYLDEKMRDTPAEAAYLKARAAGQPTDPAVRTFGAGKRPVIPLKLNLSAPEKADLVLFLKALEGDPVDPVVADPQKFVEVGAR